MNETLSHLVDKADELVSLPGIYYKVNEMVEAPNASMSDIGKLISQDPALTTRILRLANSAIYGFSREVDTVSKALTTIGTKKLRDLVLATSAVEAFDGIPNDLITMDDFWSHSIRCGAAASYLAELVNIRDRDSLFVSGLLHDIGQLTLFSLMPEPAKQILQRSLDDPDEPEISQCEKDLLGYTHAELGSELAKKWHLPDLLSTTIRYHHDPENAESHTKECYLIHIANSIAVLAELNSTEIAETDAPPIHNSAWLVTGLNESIIPDVVGTTQERYLQMRNVFLAPAA